jgi:zinc and cadmium transporter
MILTYILLGTLAGGVVSVLLAAVFSLTSLARMAHTLLSFSVGTMLAVALLDILPEVATTLAPPQIGAWLLIGLFLFFTLEKLAYWHHEHGGDPGAEDLHADHAHHHHPAGAMVVLGDALHNFVDGVMIAAAFMHDTTMGLGITLAVFVHEIPHEMGAFMVLLHSGYSRVRALALNVLSGSAAVVGGVLAYFTLAQAQQIIPYALCLSAASFIYIAMADLVPELHKHRRPRDIVQQLALGILGVAVIAGLMHLLQE